MEQYAYAAAVYFTAMNLAGFLAMRGDKRRARQRKWRIRERTLFLLAIFGGSAGIFSGMYLFRHKTRHPAFFIGIPLILTLQIIGIVLLCFFI